MTTAFDPVPEDELVRHLEWVRAVALGLVRREVDADDIVQETYARALRSPPRKGTVITAWLYTVMRRVFYERHRGDAARERREAATAGPAALPSPEEAVLLAERQRVVVDAVQALEEPYRHTIVLRYFHGAEYADIAAAQGVTEGTARSRVHRGMRLLREDLERRFGDRGEEWLAVLFPLAGLPAPPAPAPAPLPGPAAPVGAGRGPGLLVGAGVAIVAFVAGTAVWLAADDGDAPVENPDAPAETATEVQGGGGRTAGALPGETDSGEPSDAEPAGEDAVPPPPRRTVRIEIVGAPPVFDPPARLEIRPISSRNDVPFQPPPVLVLPLTDPAAPVDLDRLEDLPELLAMLDLTLRAPGYLPASGRAIPACPGDPGYPARLRLVPAAQVEGRVLLPDGTPAAGAPVMAGADDTDHSEPDYRPAFGSVLADAEGRFRLDVEAGAPARILASSPGYGSASRQVWAGAPGTTATTELALVEGRTITGRVVGPVGPALAGAELSIDTRSMMGTRFISDPVVMAVIEGDETVTAYTTTTFAADGTFSMSGLSPRLYMLRADVPPEAVGFSCDAVEPIEHAVEAPAADVRIDVVRVPVRVEVRDARGPAAGAGVLAMSRPDQVGTPATTDEDGVAVLGLRPGCEYSVGAGVTGGGGASTTITTPAVGEPAATVRFDLGARPEAAWSVRLLAPDGAPLARSGFHVWSRDDEERFVRTQDVVAEPDGTFRLTGLTPGTYRIAARPGVGVADVREGWQDEWFEVRVPNTSPTVTRVVRPGGRLRVLVVEPDDAPVLGVMTLLRNGESVRIGARSPSFNGGACQVQFGLAGWTYSSRDGPTDLVPALEPGTYELHVRPRLDGTHVPVVREIEIRRGELTFEKVVLEPR